MKKNNVLLGMFLFAFLFSMSFVIGAVVVAPASGANFTSAFFNCSYTNSSAEIVAPLSANSSFYNNGVAVSCTLVITNNSISCTPTAGQLTDGLLRNIGCKVGNATSTNWSTSNATSVNIYTNTPTCSFDVSKDTVEYMNALGIETSQASTKDALSSIGYSWVLYDPNTNSQQTSTSSAPTFSGSDFDEIGTFTLALTVTDDFQNTAVCTNKSLFVQGANGDAIPALSVVQSTQQTSASNLKYWILGIVVFLVLLTAVSFYAISMSKKR